jgi:hypothetical protein
MAIELGAGAIDPHCVDHPATATPLPAGVKRSRAFATYSVAARYLLILPEFKIVKPENICGSKLPDCLPRWILRGEVANALAASSAARCRCALQAAEISWHSLSRNECARCVREDCNA